MDRKIVLIACCKQKAERNAIACELYQSPLFRHSLEFARTLEPHKIFILSAKYGLIDANATISPYDETLSQMKPRQLQTWTQMVWRQLWTRCWPPESEFVFLAGVKYREKLITHMVRNKIEYQVPLQGMGIGEQLQALIAWKAVAGGAA